MKTVTAYIVLSLCVFLSAADAVSQDYRSVHDGVEYAQVTHKIGDEPVKIDLLRLDLTKVRLDVKMAMDTVIGTETTSSIAKRHGAVAAINAGFFRLDTSIFAGEPANFLMIDGDILSEGSNERIAIGIKNWSHMSEVFFLRPEVKFELELGGKKFPINGINREAKDGETILFTDAFHATTLTRSGCFEVAMDRNRVTQISKAGSLPIAKNSHVVSTCGSDTAELEKIARRGRKARVIRSEMIHQSSETQHSPLTNKLEDAVTGVSQLIKDGKINLTWEREKANKAFAESRHPRTAVAKLKDGKFLMVTVDGRQPGVSVGMSLQELAEYLLTVGAVDAINLDGGGSTAMFLDGKIVNKPSDTNGERKVGDAIIVTLRKQK